MVKKKTAKDYDYYSLKIPNELRVLFEKYIEKYKYLGFKNVSQFILHICQEEARKILKENPELTDSELKEEK
ncbi:MAG: hypothetical protein ACOC1X_01955 [Promethearchaeota archaeon]